MKLISMVYCPVLCLLSLTACIKTTEPVLAMDYGLVPFSEKVDARLYTSIFADSNVTVEMLKAFEAEELATELTDQNKRITYVNGLIPFNITLGVIEDDPVKQWLIDKTQENNYKAMVFGHLWQEGDLLYVIMRIHRNGINGYESYGEDKGLPIAKINAELLSARIKEVSHEVVKALVTTNVEPNN